MIAIKRVRVSEGGVRLGLAAIAGESHSEYSTRLAAAIESAMPAFEARGLSVLMVNGVGGRVDYGWLTYGKGSGVEYFPRFARDFWNHGLLAAEAEWLASLGFSASSHGDCFARCSGCGCSCTVDASHCGRCCRELSSPVFDACNTGACLESRAKDLANPYCPAPLTDAEAACAARYRRDPRPGDLVTVEELAMTPDGERKVRYTFEW